MEQTEMAWQGQLLKATAVLNSMADLRMWQGIT